MFTRSHLQEMKRRYASMHTPLIEEKFEEHCGVCGEQGIEEVEVAESFELQATMALDDAGVKSKWKKGKLYVAKRDIKKAEKALGKSFKRMKKGAEPDLYYEEIEITEADKKYPPTIETLKMIVKDKQNQVVMFKSGSARVDSFSASAMVQVYDALKPKSQSTFDKMIKNKAGFLKSQEFALKMTEETFADFWDSVKDRFVKIEESNEITDEKQVVKLFDEVGEGLKLAIYNPGNNTPGKIIDMKADYFLNSWKICCFGGFLFGREAIRRFVPNGVGTLLYTGASASLRGKANFGAFNSSKASSKSEILSSGLPASPSSPSASIS